MRYLEDLFVSENIGVITSGADVTLDIKYRTDRDAVIDLSQCNIKYQVLDKDGRTIFKDLAFLESDGMLVLPYQVTEKLNGKYNLKVFIDGFNNRGAFNILMEVR